jgi:hypothetical protein
MASTKISALPAASTLTGAETIPLVQGGVTKKVTTDQFLTAANPSYTGTLTGGTTGGTNKIRLNTAVTGGGDIQLKRGAFIGFSNAADNSNAEYIYANSGALEFGTSASTKATLSEAGNLGLGVPPSPWSLGRAVEVGQVGNALFGYLTETHTTNNCYYNGGWKFAYDGAAGRYMQQGGGHSWFTAPSGTAGNPISFTQAMTLDSAGDLTTANGRINLITVGRGGGGVASNTASGCTPTQQV